MRFEFLKQENEHSALVLDTEKGRILRVPIEEFSGALGSAAGEQASSFAPPPKSVGETIVPTVFKKQEPAPGASRHQRMPPALAGVFEPADTPGAAIETLRV